MWAVVVAGIAGWGAQAAPAQVSEEPDDPLEVYLVTMGPGEEVWNRFGHNALWIRDRRTGEDLVWNWGIFDFDQVGFVPRLIRGRMLYSMRGFTLRQTLAQYEAEGRDVWAQELRLTPVQKAELDRFVRWNSQPANRDYLYNYYLDNCSTRVRDALDRVLGGAIERHFSGMQTGTTWRWHTRRLVQMAPWVYGGIALVLGRRGDEAISAYQEMFLPLRLRAHMAGFFVEGRDGTMRPLVADEFRLVEGRQGPVPDAPGRKWPLYLALGIAAGAVVVVAGTLWRRGPWGRAAAGLPVALWSLLAGVSGSILLGAYLTDHIFWYANENLFQATPLSLLLAVLVLAAIARPGLVGAAARVAGWVAALAILGLVLDPLPPFTQRNPEILALAVPAHLAVAWMLRRWRDGRIGETASA